MPAYIVLLNYTDQGIRNVKQSPERRKATIASAEKLGIKVKDAYWTVGAYDAVLVADAPNDEAFTAFPLGIGTQGNVRTQTLRAFSTDEMNNILFFLS